MGKVKWDSAADQILLTKILETHDMSVDVARVAEAWPAKEGDKPTPRAIKERITKIKEICKNASTGVGGTVSPITPKKRAPSKKTAEDMIDETPTKKQKTPAKAKAKALVTAVEPVKEECSPVKIKQEMSLDEEEALFDSIPTIRKEELFDDTPPRLDPRLRETSLDPVLGQKADDLWYSGKDVSDE